MRNGETKKPFFSKPKSIFDSQHLKQLRSKQGNNKQPQMLLMKKLDIVAWLSQHNICKLFPNKKKEGIEKDCKKVWYETIQFKMEN